MSAPDAKRPPRQGRPLDNSSPGSDTDILAEVLAGASTTGNQSTICEFVCNGRDDCVICPNRVTT